VAAIALPYLPIGRCFELTPLPPAMLAALLAITAAYATCSDIVKRRFGRLRLSDY